MVINMNGFKIYVYDSDIAYYPRSIRGKILIDDIVMLNICTKSIKYVLENYRDLDVAWQEFEDCEDMEYLLWALLYDNSLCLSEECHSRARSIRESYTENKCDQIREIVPSIVKHIEKIKQMIIERDKQGG